MKTSVRSSRIMFSIHDIRLVFPLKPFEWLFYGLLFTLFSGVVLWLRDPHTFPLTTLKIQGNVYTTQQELLKVLSVHHFMDNLLNINLSALQTALLTLPWVRLVQIQRHWPDTLVIFLEEHRPMALWRPDPPISIQGVVLINDQEQLFVVPHLPAQLSSTTNSTRLPMFTGLPHHIHQMLAYYHTFSVLFQKLKLNIHQIGCDTRQAWYLMLDNGIQLILGRGDITSRVQGFINIYRHLHWVQKNMTIDLRYTHGLAVRINHEENHAKR